MTELDALLAGIVADPREETRWLVLADWLQEYDDPRRAELLRLHRKLIATCCEPDAHPQRAEWQTRMVELLVAGVKPCVPQETLTLPGGVPMTFSFIPEGAFLMGSENGDDDEKPVHRVELTRAFFMGVSPVTQAQWFAVMGTNPSHFKGDQRPVEQVSWDDCQRFGTTLSELTARKVGLPTEAEWEYACRAGTTSDYWSGSDEAALLLAGWFSKNSREKTQPVGQLAMNPWGLYDVHGNVWEWCADWFSDYSVDDQTDSQSRSNGQYCVLRGGCWYYDSDFCRAAFRIGIAPAYRDNYCGFRVCFRLD